MSKEICLLHANCQGLGLAALLNATPAFARNFEIRHYFNYTKEEIAEADIEKCSLFLHQYLAPKWGNLSTEQVLSRLPQQAKSICLPNFFFKGYWPHWTDKFQGIDFADSVLESLLAKGLDIQQVMLLYMKDSSVFFGDVEKTALDSIEYEKQKEKYTPIKYAHILENDWRHEQLFITVNHPANRLFFHMANELLKLIGLGSLPREAREGFVHPQGDFWLPIHPVVGARLRLPFVSKNREYECFGTKITHATYILRYLACRKHNIKDLVNVLRQEKDYARRQLED